MAKIGTQYRRGNVVVVAANEVPSTVRPVAIGNDVPVFTLDGVEAPSRHIAHATGSFEPSAVSGQTGPPSGSK